MKATITETGQTFPVETITAEGVYLRAFGHLRFFALPQVEINHGMPVEGFYA